MGPTLKIVYSRYSKTPIYRGIWDGKTRGKSEFAVNRGFM